MSQSNWEQFQALKGALIESGQFDAAPRQAQRLIWTAPDRRASILVDFIPFGGVTSESKRLAWPPDKDVVMNVAGFEEALESSLRLRIEEDLVIRVASIPGLAVLKLIAWQDRRHENDKDAADLLLLLTNYADAGNLDRIYGEELPVLEAAQFDLELAGPSCSAETPPGSVKKRPCVNSRRSLARNNSWISLRVR